MKRAISIAVAAVVCGTTPAFGAISDAEFAQLRAEFSAMSQRLNALEAENSALREMSQTTVTELEIAQTTLSEVKDSSAASSWTDTIKLKGDFRYRYEAIDVEESDSRERNRIRARAQLSAKLANNVDVGIGVASGGDDPVSSNQTLGGGGSSKELKLDLAYAKWNMNDGSYLQAGKFKNPLYKPQKSGLLWDGDWRPEGVSAGWAGEHLFGAFFGNWLESDTKKSNDAFAWGLQGGAKFNIGSASLTTALGYFDFPTAGNESYFDDDFFGNSSVDGVYLYDYEMVELGADLGMNIFDMPFNVFANFVQNQDADEYDTGWQAGAKLGKASRKGGWELGYRYQDLEADAVLGLLSDSDFAGGGTDGKGHILSGAYGINPQWKVGFTWFLDNEAGEKNLADAGGALSYDRIMLDTAWKF
ncbi:MAG: putative porin [Halioglobus sp.]